MHNFVRYVFTLIMCVIIGTILYFLFFGTTNKVTSETYEIEGGWKGVVGVASDTIETSISRYYYNYCFLPTLKSNDYLDGILGVGVINPLYSSALLTAKTSFTTKGVANLGTFSSRVNGSGVELNYK